MKRMMNSGNFNPMRWLTLVCCLLPLVAGTATVLAQQPVPSKAAVSPAAAPLTAAKSAAAAEETAPAAKKPGEEGIKVHGHWTIDVRNPDGALAQHHEFENALSSSGGSLLVGFISGQLSPGAFIIVLGGPTGGTAPCAGSQYNFCGLVQSTATAPGSFYCTLYLCNTGLTVTPAYGTDLNGPYSLTLAGSITANQAGSVGFVEVGLEACAATPSGTSPSEPTTILPAACAAETNTSSYYFSPLTQTNPAPISVANGQLIQVQVVISFS